MKTTPVIADAGNPIKAFIRRIEEAAETSINLCYQCGKCTAGCPAAFAMDMSPRRIIRLLQLEFVEEALEAESIWICASCEICSARCPRGVDIASLMDAMRREALRQGKIENRVAAFNKGFLTGVKYFGRTYETGLLLYHNYKTRQLFKDAELGLPMFKRKKAAILPHQIKGKEEIKKIFKRVEEAGGE